MNAQQLKGWTPVAPDSMPPLIVKLLLVDAVGRKAMGCLLTTKERDGVERWEVNGTSGPTVRAPQFWQVYPELPEGYDY